MGLDYYTARFLLQAKAGDERLPPHAFGNLLTIGRQNFFLTRPQLDDLSSRFNFDAAVFLKAHSPAQLNYADAFLLSICGAAGVESLDASSYEQATHIHDMNSPLPARLHSRFDTILEAGSLEHIFNFPQAIANLMRALKPGGRLFIQTPANNYFGHGFYQFSPELFYRVLSPANGFDIKRMRVLEHFYPCHFFATDLHEVTDPARIGKRVQLINNQPALLLIDARKTEEKPLFETPPQQSDYVPLWESNTATTTAPLPPCLQANWKQRLYSLPLQAFRSLFLQRLANRRNSPSLQNREFFRKVD